MKKGLWLAALLGAASFTANATTIVQFFTLPLNVANWTSSIPVQQFDPSLGNLNSVSLFLDGDLYAKVGFENTEGVPTSVDTNAQVTLSVRNPTNTVVLANVIPANLVSDPLTSYDGVDDYGGPSGRNYGFNIGDIPKSPLSQPPLPALTASASKNTVINAPGIPSYFVGLGTAILPVRAQAQTFVSTDGGTVGSHTQTLAGVDITVTYDYTPNETNIPEPATSAIVGGALVLLGCVGRQFRS